MFPIQDSIPTRTVPVVTRALILINVIVFFFEVALPKETLEQVVYLFGIVPARFTHPDWAASVGFPFGSYWSLLTHQFLHGGWFHIISNMWALWIFGDNVEDAMGHARFAIFYLLCGVLAGVTHILILPDLTVPSLGASGAIAGILGAYFLLYPKSWIVVLLPIFFIPFFFELPAVVYLGIWFVTQLFSGTLSLVSPQQMEGIAFWAHVGGFIAGLILCRLFTRRHSRELQPDEQGLEWAWQR
jgi:membrane associated rhomboid family serine protease